MSPIDLDSAYGDGARLTSRTRATLEWLGGVAIWILLGPLLPTLMRLRAGKSL